MSSCDFCQSSIIGVKEYKCRDFMIAALIAGNDKPTQLQNSVGNWWACLVCSTYIDSNNREALTKRAVNLIAGDALKLTSRPDAYDLLVKSVNTMHDGFFANRILD